MMNSSCIAGCLEAQTPLKVSFVKLYQWAEADKEFLRMICMNKENLSHNLASPTIPESFASRQRYLRSYTFSKKETVAQKTKKWLDEKQLTKIKSKGRSCSFLEAILKFLSSCVVEVDVHTEETTILRRKVSATRLLS